MTVMVRLHYMLADNLFKALLRFSFCRFMLNIHISENLFFKLVFLPLLVIGQVLQVLLMFFYVLLIFKYLNHCPVM